MVPYFYYYRNIVVKRWEGTLSALTMGGISARSRIAQLDLLCARMAECRAIMNLSFVPGIALATLAAGCAGYSSSTTAPTPAPAANATRVIRLGGNLDLGELNVLHLEEYRDGLLTVSNDGNDVLNITGMNGPCATNGALKPMSNTRFTVPPAETVSVTFRFAIPGPSPDGRLPVPFSCSGTITVFGDQTSGANTIAVTARAVMPPCQAVPGGLLCE